MPAAINAPVQPWPPDVFAIVGLVLKSSGAYERVVHRWPPNGQKLERWHAAVSDVAKQWRQSAPRGIAPTEVERWWAIVVAGANLPVHAVRDHAALADAMVQLVAVADEASAGVGFTPSATDAFNVAASRRLETTFSLSAVDPAWIRVLPKTHNPLDGLTFRSLTHHLALWTNPEVDAKWKHYPMRHVKDELNVLLLPWPLRLHPGAFRPADRSLASDMPDKFGLFTYEALESADIERIKAIVTGARGLVEPIHAVILPELSMTRDDFDELRDALPDTLLIAGVGTPATDDLGSNEVAVAPPEQPWTETELQSKHHRGDSTAHNSVTMV